MTYQGHPPRVAQTPDGRRLVVSRVVDAPADEVWDVLISVRYWPEWGPSVSAVRGVEEKISEGSRGDVRVAGAWVPFAVETCRDHR
ncbi:SRPBCC family protein [Haloferax sp. S1W]|uniref:SRPBCC family protein n=1 Tax=Haloferax sp. S1W TaxID=3377110 RepID=UPI0037C7AB50